ncbi:cell division topological specificity factor MinE [Paracoccus sp. SM22M-07]|uniref:cell division topological specificity factor MinE n=1 Tax=Paracoccus sp. SM22M-07 TaxID=1520813 RepID=UPI00091CA869|nr:cell division topological specificity factor MinE [Paracoccus sp. SM22M-07]OJH43541.1 cell division topological specificity factor [Paracoccus sp. SM22M-07]
MSLFSFARKKQQPKSAQTAKDRLQILLAHERSSSGMAEVDYLPMLQRDIVAAIRKYVPIGETDVDVRMERGDQMSSLEINIELPKIAKSKDG